MHSIAHSLSLQKEGNKIGIALACTIFLLLFAGNDVFTGYFLQGFDPFLLVFSCFVIVAVFYHFSYFTNHRKGYVEKIKSHFTDVFWLNVTTAVSWLGGFYALKFIEASVVGALNFAVSPVIVIAMALLLKPRRTIYKWEAVSSVAVLTALAFLTWASISGRSSVGAIPSSQAAAGLFAALAAGIAIAGNTVFSKRLSEAGLSAHFVLASRFYLLIVTSLLSWWVAGMPVGAAGSFVWIGILSITFLGVILPLYILQKVIECLEPITISFIILLRPVAAYLLQCLDPRLSLSTYSLIGVLAIIGFTALGILARNGRNRGI